MLICVRICVDVYRPGSRIDVSQQLPSIQEVDMDTGKGFLLQKIVKNICSDDLLNGSGMSFTTKESIRDLNL